MNKSQKWSVLSSIGLMISSAFLVLSSSLSRSSAPAATSPSTSARDVGIIRTLSQATSAEVFRSDAPHPQLTTLSAAQTQQVISRLHFVALNCLPPTFPTPKGTKDKAICFSFDSSNGSAMIVLDLNSGADFYGDKPNKGPRTNAFLCPESGRALRDLLFQDPKFKTLLAPT